MAAAAVSRSEKSLGKPPSLHSQEGHSVVGARTWVTFGSRRLEAAEVGGCASPPPSPHLVEAVELVRIRARGNQHSELAAETVAREAVMVPETSGLAFQLVTKAQQAHHLPGRRPLCCGKTVEAEGVAPSHPSARATSAEPPSAPAARPRAKWARRRDVADVRLPRSPPA